MKKSNRNILFDTWVMFKRCFLISVRNPEALLTATLIPFCLILLFGTIFGSISDVGAYNYIDFIVPGIIFQSIAQASQYSAMHVAADMTKGIIDRFRCMSISQSAVLIGHTCAGVMRGIVSNAVILATAPILGFRPQAGLAAWLVAIALLLLINVAFTLIAVLCGMISKSVEGATGLLFPLFILPFISSGFAPVDTMPSGIGWFAAIQPMTPMIDSLRALTLHLPLENSLWSALAWCMGIILIAFAAATQVYKRRTA